MSKDKLDWIDLLKGIGILAVVLVHLATPLGTWIHSWVMPLFFVISGYLFQPRENFRAFALHHGKKLMVPYFLFSALAVVIEIAKRTALHRTLPPPLDWAKAILWHMDMPWLLQSYGFVLWFLPTLLVARLLLYPLEKIPSPSVQFLCAGMLFYASLWIDLPFAIDNGANVVLWLWIGSMFRCWGKEQARIALPLSLATIMAIYLWTGIPVQDIAFKTYASLPYNLLYTIATLCGLMVLVRRMPSTLPGMATVRALGANSMLLFVIHPYANNLADLLVNRIYPRSWPLKFLLSIAFLQALLFVKQRRLQWWIFRYV